MKLAFSTLGCPDWTFDEVLERARDMGYQAIELRGVNGKMRADEMDVFRRENRKATMEKVRAHGLTICGFGTSAMFHNPDQLEDALSDGRAAIELCADIGVKHVRVFGNSIRPDEDENEVIHRVADGIRILCDEAKGTDVDVLLEVHGEFNTRERILRAHELVNRDNFAILWDVEHSDETDKGDFMPFYEATKHLIRHVHIKDHVRLADGGFRLCPTGEGDIPLRQMINKMLEDGYPGYFSLEWEKKWHPELRAPEEEFPWFVKWAKERIGQ